MLDKIKEFVENGGRLRKGEEPRFGEPFYGDYMKQYLSLHYKPGDKVKLQEVFNNGESKNCEGIIISMDYDLHLSLLTSGKTVHKDKRNKKYIHYSFIKSIELIKADDGKFDLSAVDPDEWNRLKNMEKYKESDDEKTESRKECRAKDEREFHLVYPEVDFHKSHIIKVCDGCTMYWPFDYDEITAEIFMVRDMDKITPIPCETGTPFPNKKSVHAYNCKEKDSYPDLYLYLPDYGFCYEDVNIVCVWTINTSIDGKKATVKKVNIYHVGEISPIKDEHNMIFIDMHILPLLEHGDSLFAESAHMLESMMNKEMYFVISTEDDNADEAAILPLKLPAVQSNNETEKYLCMALGSLVSSLEEDEEEKMVARIETFCSIDTVPERYYSSAWRKCRKGYEFQALT